MATTSTATPTVTAPATTAIPRTARRSSGWTGSLGGLPLYQWLRPLVVGIVHGLAGSAAIALLVLAAVGEPAWAMAYLLLFGVGTIGGMMLITCLLSAPFAFSSVEAAAVQLAAAGRFRPAELRLRPVPGLRDRLHGRRPVHRDAELDDPH